MTSSMIPAVKMSMESLLNTDSSSEFARGFGPCFPRPVEAPERAAQERSDDSKNADGEHDQQEHDGLRAPLPGETNAGGFVGTPVQVRPRDERGNQQPGEQDAADERAVD